MPSCSSTCVWSHPVLLMFIHRAQTCPFVIHQDSLKAPLMWRGEGSLTKLFNPETSLGVVHLLLEF